MKQMLAGQPSEADERRFYVFAIIGEFLGLLATGALFLFLLDAVGYRILAVSLVLGLSGEVFCFLAARRLRNARGRRLLLMIVAFLLCTWPVLVIVAMHLSSSLFRFPAG